MIGWILPIMALAWLMGLLSYILTEPEPDRRIRPLSPEDQALWEHYRDRDREKVRQMKLDRHNQKRLWDEVNFPNAVWEYRAQYIKPRRVA